MSKLEIKVLASLFPFDSYISSFKSTNSTISISMCLINPYRTRVIYSFEVFKGCIIKRNMKIDLYILVDTKF